MKEKDTAVFLNRSVSTWFVCEYVNIFCHHLIHRRPQTINKLKCTFIWLTDWGFFVCFFFFFFNLENDRQSNQNDFKVKKRKFHMLNEILYYCKLHAQKYNSMRKNTILKIQATMSKKTVKSNYIYKCYCCQG